MDRPFICYNGACVSNFSDCEIHPRTSQPPTIMVYTSDKQDIDIDIIFSSTGLVYGKLYIPSNIKGNYKDNVSPSKSEYVLS